MTLNATLAKRYEGRLFVENGRLHMVVEVDVAAGTAYVSSHDGSGPQVNPWSVVDVGRRLAAENGLLLDGLARADESERITEKEQGWFFTSREGPQGPFKTRAQATRELKAYIMTSQGTTSVKH